MSNQGTIADPVRAKPEVDIDTLISLNPELLDDSYVYVHCCFQNRWKDMLVRIWKTTYLIDQATRSRSALIHAENISIAPMWTMVPDNREYTFLLIFGSLPASCKVFDLLEDIALPSGFHVTGIRRNETDVYRVNI